MAESPDRSVEVRFTWPDDVHKKIKSYQRMLSATKDRDATMEEALIDFIRKSKVKAA